MLVHTRFLSRLNRPWLALLFAFAGLLLAYRNFSLTVNFSLTAYMIKLVLYEAYLTFNKHTGQVFAHIKMASKPAGPALKGREL